MKLGCFRVTAWAEFILYTNYGRPPHIACSLRLSLYGGVQHLEKIAAQGQMAATCTVQIYKTVPFVKYCIHTTPPASRAGARLLDRQTQTDSMLLRRYAQLKTVSSLALSPSKCTQQRQTAYLAYTQVFK